jgi:CheY-like chemotaxis protein
MPGGPSGGLGLGLALVKGLAVANDGRAGVETARTFQPDVVLCGIGLPVMDGYQVARAILADPALAPTFLVNVPKRRQEPVPVTTSASAR